MAKAKITRDEISDKLNEIGHLVSTVWNDNWEDYPEVLGVFYMIQKFCEDACSQILENSGHYNCYVEDDEKS